MNRPGWIFTDENHIEEDDAFDTGRGSFRKYITAAGYFLKKAGKGMSVTGNFALTGALVLLGVWLWGRVMEALNGNTVFDGFMTWWLGALVFCLLAIWLVGAGIASLENLVKSERRKPAIFAWVLFLALAVLILADLEGFRIFSSSVLAVLSGSTGSAQQGSFLLFKFHPANPMLAVNLVVSKLAGLSVEAVMPFARNPNFILAFFIWSLVYAIVLLVGKNRVGTKTLHLLFAACGLGVLILLKSTSSITREQMVFFHGFAVVMLFFQVFLTYSLLRGLALQENGMVKRPDPFSTTFYAAQPQKENTGTGLPPSALTLALCVLFVLPVISDLGHQFYTNRTSAGILPDSAAFHKPGAGDMVVSGEVSIHSGPAYGDDIVGVLSKGALVFAKDRKSGWVNIGKDRWIPEKYVVSATAGALKSK
jgi:hypothetical protein